MGILSKIKSVFFQEEVKVEEVVSQETIAPVAIVEPKGEVIGQCALCKQDIGLDDRTRDLNGYKCHKRCVKRATKEMFAGKSPEEVFKQST